VSAVAATSACDRLRELIAVGGVVVLSGAGLSTESGIPDYRGPSGRLRARLPITVQEFRASADHRRRYWARSHAGWGRMTRARPNAGHLAVAELQRRGVITDIVTQNVDGLHQAAGARDVIELHGGLRHVLCMDCGARTPRAQLDERLRAVNGELATEIARINPDGDVELADELVASFELPGCESCGSDLLKPDVVFFGENVPRERVTRCFKLVERASSLLVLGSSLTVMSGLRFVHRAARDGIPVAIVNQGVTRGDELASIKLERPLGSTLTELATAREHAHGACDRSRARSRTLPR
jgi:NAD-dependent SIR2 family protein deacetylase